MDLFEALKGRRSVRSYKDEQIKDEELNKILVFFLTFIIYYLLKYI